MSTAKCSPSLASTPHISRALPTPSWGLNTLQRSRIIVLLPPGHFIETDKRSNRESPST